MRYDVARTSPQSEYAPKQVRIPPNRDITYISWRIEGGSAPLAVGWRSLASGNGLVDPMQIANEVNRTIVGATLTAGALLDIT